MTKEEMSRFVGARGADPFRSQSGAGLDLRPPWNGPNYMFSGADTRPPLDRSTNNGVRLMKTDASPVPAKTLEPIVRLARREPHRSFRDGCTRAGDDHFLATLDPLEQPGQVVLASTNVKSCQELVEIPALGDYVVDHRILDNRSADAIIGSSESAWCQGESERL